MRWREGRWASGGFTGLLQVGDEVLYPGETLLGVFGQSSEDDHFYGGGEGWDVLKHGWWRGMQMLCSEFGVCALEGRCATEPFVNDNAEGILIAGSARIPLDNFWGDV